MRKRQKGIRKFEWEGQKEINLEVTRDTEREGGQGDSAW